jgi:rod shape-determining protein MreB
LFTVISDLRAAIAGPDLAIDLGSSNTRLYAGGRGVFADEPSIVGEAVPGILEQGDTPIHPVRGGVIANVPAAAALVRQLIRRCGRRGVIRPRALVCAPSDASGFERAARLEVVRLAGVSVVEVAPEPLAAALGAGLDPGSDYAQMLVDIGGGVTDIAVFRGGRVIASAALRLACTDLERALEDHVQTCHGARPAPFEAQRILAKVGFIPGNGRAEPVGLAGPARDKGDTTVHLGWDEIQAAISPVMDRIVARIASVYRRLPHGAACEVIEEGICLAGGGACLPGIAGRITSGTTLEVFPAPDPLHAVINGAACLLKVRH